MVAHAQGLPDDELSDEELESLFQAAAQRQIAQQLAAGHPVYSSGIGPDADKLYVHTPDGQRLQYKIAEDGQRVIVRDTNR